MKKNSKKLSWFLYIILIFFTFFAFIESIYNSNKYNDFAKFNIGNISTNVVYVDANCNESDGMCNVELKNTSNNNYNNVDLIANDVTSLQVSVNNEDFSNNIITVKV